MSSTPSVNAVDIKIMLDTQRFKTHLTGLVEQSTNPVSFPVYDNQPASPRFIVAYSGGLDSHVLLHLLHACKISCRAVYIEHGLQAASKTWSEHCAATCQQLAIEFVSISVNAQAASGESPEASARTARYQALADLMAPGEILLTAQHLQDQAETLLLQMLRTAGPAGLAAMPEAKPFACGWHLRPLLGVKRTELEAYAHKHQLQWVEDPSNKDQRYDRNFFRQSILPLLTQRWPSINQTLSNVSALQSEAAELMNDLAAIDAATSVDGDRLSINQLIKLSKSRQRNLIRYWLQQCGLDAPTAKRLKEILGSMLTAAADKMPVVEWGDTEVRRFQGQLYAMKRLQSVATEQPIAWHQKQPLRLPGLNANVMLEAADSGLSADVIAQPLMIRFRQGGERIRPVGRAHTMELKKLMQQASIPPWQRDRIPLLYLDHQLIAVADYWVADAFKNTQNQPGWRFISR
ncbi:MAG: tRNA lysidine(34) synthetase TilS [Gammaproteobacteria bacterium]|nr:tRNA lysidine(34) synthetase TilS [Gammaproteobacteria bacterium]